MKEEISWRRNTDSLKILFTQYHIVSAAQLIQYISEPPEQKPLLIVSHSNIRNAAKCFLLTVIQGEMWFYLACDCRIVLTRMNEC